MQLVRGREHIVLAGYLWVYAGHIAEVAGADYLVVGRPILDAVDPQAAEEEIVVEMQSAFDTRGG